MHARESQLEQRALCSPQRAPQYPRRRIANRGLDEPLGRLAQNAARLPVRFPVNHPAGRLRRAPTNPRAAQRRRVDPGDVPILAGEGDGAVAGDGIQRVPIRQAGFRPERMVPVAAEQPSVARQVTGPRRYQRNGLSKRPDIGQV